MLALRSHRFITTIRNGEGPIPQDPRYRFLDRGNSLFDIRHRFSQTLLYEPPLGEGKRYHFGRKWENTLLGNWQINVILRAQTGLPFAPVLANSVANTGASSRPNLVGDWHISNPTITHWFNTALNTPGAPWATPAQFAYGNAGRGILRGPSRTKVDLFGVQAVGRQRDTALAVPGRVLQRFELSAIRPAGPNDREPQRRSDYGYRGTAA